MQMGKHMGLWDKIANAKLSSWLGEGLTEEEVKKIIEEAQNQAKQEQEKKENL